jgi:hypothetical protein
MSDFFEIIWGASEGTYVFLPSMRDGVWTEGPGMEPGVASWDWILDDEGPVDHYFTPLRYNGLRKKALLGNPGVIFADMDKRGSGTFRLEPSVVVQTSPNHFHLYWLLDEPVHPQEWAPRAQGWTYEIGADPGGWDATQVLRVPSTRNYKYNPPVDVWIAKLDPDCKYSLDQFPSTNTIGVDPDDKNAPTPDRSRGQRLMADCIASGSVPLSSIYWITASEEDIKALGTIDRSRVLWQQECVLLEHGLSPTQVFDLLYHAGINKWRGQPLKLWREINKAAHVSSPSNS